MDDMYNDIVTFIIAQIILFCRIGWNLYADDDRHVDPNDDEYNDVLTWIIVETILLCLWVGRELYKKYVKEKKILDEDEKISQEEEQKSSDDDFSGEI